jgi:hypothetical protein
MSIFDDLIEEGPIYKQLEKDGMIRKAFDQSLIEALINWGWYEDLYEDDDPDFPALQQLPIYIVFVNQYKRQSVDMLIGTYEPLVAVKKAGHFVDFLLIDAKQKIACGLGLGRKNRIFTCFSSNGAEFKFDDTSIKETLAAGMPWDVLSKLETTVGDLGQEFFQRDNIPGNQETLEEALENGPNDDGYYSLEDSDDELSEEEIRNYISDHELHDENIEDAESVLTAIFPSLEVNELNTGDY